MTKKQIKEKLKNLFDNSGYLTQKHLDVVNSMDSYFKKHGELSEAQMRYLDGIEDVLKGRKLEK